MRAQSVTIVQSWLSPYRAPFYEELKNVLAREGVELRVVYGQGSPTESLKRAHTELVWGHFVPNRYVSLGGHEVSWQPALGQATDTDLVIVEQAVKRLLNWLLVVRRRGGGFRLAFWGHGRNFQSRSTTSPAERAKRSLSRRADWWFAYTGASAEVVAALPFDRDRITVVNNSIDTRALATERDMIRAEPAAVEQLRRRLGLRGAHVGLFVGGMYPEKRLDFLVACCDRLRALVPDFEMIFVGAGPDEGIAREAAATRPWVHYAGPVFGPAVAEYFAVGSVVLMPGLVGLAVLDSFVCETPMVTTDLPIHSPEIEYLQSGLNGIVVSPPDDVGAFAGTVAELLLDEEARRLLVDGCRRSAKAFSIERMAENFGEGVMSALARPHASSDRARCR